MKETLNLPDPNHVLDCIERWRKLDLRKKSDDDVDEELKSLLSSLKTICTSSKKANFDTLWRIRKLEYLIKDISECWEPPSDVTPMGRCNSKGHPVLYVSRKLKTPFEELSIKPKKQQIYVIKYKQKYNFELSNIVPINPIPTDQDNNPIFDEKSSISYRILREFIRSEFLKPAGKDTEYLYRISGSICRVWFDENDRDGWLYPSVQSPNDLNLAIKPEAAHSKLEIKGIRIVKMVEENEIINSVNINDDFIPFIKSQKMVIQSDFKGEIINGEIFWRPNNALGGDF